MNLGDGRGAQGLVVDAGEDPPQRLVVRRFQDVRDGFKGQRGHVGAQFGQLLTIGLGQHVLAHGQNLTDFNKNRAKFFDNGPEFFGGDPLSYVVLR